MLYFRRKIEGKPANEIQKDLNYNRIELYMETTSYEFDVIISATNDCEACKNIDRKIITINESLENNIIPYNECKRKQGCACLYSIKLKRDKNDRLIKR